MTVDDVENILAGSASEHGTSRTFPENASAKADPTGTNSPSTQHHLGDFVHVPTPGDHYSAATGSAVITVIYEMTRVAAARGKRSSILVSRGTRHDYQVGACVVIEAVRKTPKVLKAMDIAMGRAGLPRWFGEQSYHPAAAALDRDFDGTIFLHNCPAALRLFRKRCPAAQICLWAHNELFCTFSVRETRRVVALAERVICVSRYIAEDLQSRCDGDDGGKIRVVHNGVDTTRFQPALQRLDDRLPVILFVGRVIPEKGPDLLLKAAMKIHGPSRRFRVRIVGSSGFSASDPLTPYETELRRIAAPLGDAVEFQAFVDRENVVREYQGGTVFCAPSTWNEPVSLTVSEAMASGLPTIASRRGGIPEIGSDAILYFDPPDVDTLAGHLAHLLDNPAVREQWGQKARKQAESICWEKQYAVLSDALARRVQTN